MKMYKLKHISVLFFQYFHNKTLIMHVGYVCGHQKNGINPFYYKFFDNVQIVCFMIFPEIFTQEISNQKLIPCVI